MDILDIVFAELSADQEIASQAAGKIKFYEFPDSMTMDVGPYIVIEPLDVPIPGDFADDQYLSYEVLISIETWSKSRVLTKQIADKIEAILWDLGLVQNGGLDQYDEGVFRNVKRYRGKFYREEVV